jgi:hypothetical protein
MEIRKMNIDEWLQYGIDRGYCTPTCCATHDGIYITADEEEQTQEGDDPCVHVTRLSHELAHHKALEANSNETWYRSEQ